jgi:hypothetical protein
MNSPLMELTPTSLPRGPVKAGDKASPDRIEETAEDDWNRRRRFDLAASAAEVFPTITAT